MWKLCNCHQKWRFLGPGGKLPHPHFSLRLLWPLVPCAFIPSSFWQPLEPLAVPAVIENANKKYKKYNKQKNDYFMLACFCVVFVFFVFFVLPQREKNCKNIWFLLGLAKNTPRFPACPWWQRIARKDYKECKECKAWDTCTIARKSNSINIPGE